MVCGVEQFSSSTKYDSGSGWPSFWDVIDQTRIRTRADASAGQLVTKKASAGQLVTKDASAGQLVTKDASAGKFVTKDSGASV